MLTRMESFVLTYPKLKERLSKNSADQAKVLKCLHEIAAQFSRPTLDTFKKMLDTALPKLYDGINFSIQEGLDFKKLCKENCVVLVPNHQSHADYIALNYAIYKEYKFPLYIAGGVNLNIFPIGTLFRKSGCFFIRRSFNNDIVYKLTLEAYLFWLLAENKPIEFFFEGGRSRTGKLLPPRFGLYNMILESHSHLPEDKKKPLLFVPVSIAHEYVPEQKSLARELAGGKKKKETSGQLLKLFRLLSVQMGTIHIQVGRPIEAVKSPEKSLKDITQYLAFDCFREVGRKMFVTPSSLLAFVLLDEPEGALKWNEICSKAKKIINFCKVYNIPFTDSLLNENFDETLERALDIFINNKKIDVIGKAGQGHVFYAIKRDARIEMLYFKNTILHHFLVPWIINSMWINLFNGKVNSVKELKSHFLDLRSQLKYEFYLPTVKQFFLKALTIISNSIGRRVRSLEDCMKLSHKELYTLANDLGVMSRACSYLLEAYYVSALTVKVLHIENKDGFKVDNFIKKSRDVFEVEKRLSRVIRYSESYQIPLMKNSLKYLSNLKLLSFVDGYYKVDNIERLDEQIKKYEEEITEQMKFNMRV